MTFYSYEFLFISFIIISVTIRDSKNLKISDISIPFITKYFMQIYLISIIIF